MGWVADLQAQPCPQEEFHFPQACKGNLAVSPGVGSTKLNPTSKERVQEHVQFEETPVSAAPREPSVIRHFLQLTADPARTECQIAGGGPAPVKCWHPIQTVEMRFQNYL